MAMSAAGMTFRKPFLVADRRSKAFFPFTVHDSPFTESL